MNFQNYLFILICCKLFDISLNINLDINLNMSINYSSDLLNKIFEGEHKNQLISQIIASDKNAAKIVPDRAKYSGQSSRKSKSVDALIRIKEHVRNRIQVTLSNRKDNLQQQCIINLPNVEG